jgi:hypothetical protein
MKKRLSLWMQFLVLTGGPENVGGVQLLFFGQGSAGQRSGEIVSV